MAAIDYESASVLQFDVVATDGGNPPLSGTATVVINVLDANDQAPQFSQVQFFVGFKAKTLHHRPHMRRMYVLMHRKILSLCD